MRYIAPFLAFSLFIGCASDSKPTPPTVTSAARVDPRLLEQTDERASSFAEAQAKAYHQTTDYAMRYTVFQRSLVLAHGGYSARFGTSSNSAEGVRYYFDEQGKMLRTAISFPPY